MLWVNVVYASLVLSLIKYLWHHLGRIGTAMQDLWLVGGDFNSILYT